MNPGPYAAPGAPPVSTVADVKEAAELMNAKSTLTAAQKQKLVPDGSTLAAWGVTDSSPAKHRQLAERLMFTASAFELGLLGSVLIPALLDDPYDAFATPTAAGATVDELGAILEGFYAELGKANELACGHRGIKLSLADNVVLIVSGDTPKNAFVQSGWGDGTINNSNTLFVRSNGFLQPGWFGKIAPGQRSNFDPTTGNLSAGTAVATSTTGALAGVLHAISRGNAQFVSAVTQASYQGVLAPNAP